MFSGSNVLGMGVIAAVLSSGCGQPPEGVNPGECADGADNDANGLFDCNDPGCAAGPDCATNNTTSDPTNNDVDDDPNPDSGDPGDDPETDTADPGDDPNPDSGDPGDDPNPDSGDPGDDPDPDSGDPGDDPGDGEDTGGESTDSCDIDDSLSTDGGIQTDGSTPTYDTFSWEQGDFAAQIYGFDSSFTGQDACSQGSNLPGYSQYYLQIIINGTTLGAGSYTITAFAEKTSPPGAMQAESFLGDSLGGTPIQAESGSFTIDSVSSGGDLVISSMNIEFADGTIITNGGLGACYCEALPDGGEVDTGAKP